MVKKINLFLLVVLMNTMGFAQQSLELTFNYRDFSLETLDDVTSITTSLKERIIYGDSLSPNLPFFPYRIILKDEQKDVSFSVCYSDTLLAENINLIANPLPSVRNINNISHSIRIAKKSMSVPVINAGVKKQNGKSYLLLKVTPFLYDNISKQIRFVKSIRLDFHGMDVGQNIELAYSIDNVLSSSNFRQNTTYNTDTIDYLIITNSTLADSFTQLAQWKRKKCLRTKVLVLDSIYAKYPQFETTDFTAKIKACIMDYASPLRKKWVLLGGDDSVVPAKFCYVPHLLGSEDITPCDWYYACFDNDPDLTWDTNGNGKAGEIGDSLDYTPCVYLSRLPVRTPQQVIDYTNKLINYERGIGISNNFLFAGYSFGNYYNGKSDSHLLSDKIYDFFVDDHWNGNPKRLYDTGTDYLFTINGDNFKDVIDSQFNIIHELSHGDTILWATGEQQSSYYQNSHANSQTNMPGSVIVSGACLTNAFDKEPCLSECLLRNPQGGAVAYFGSSREAYGGEGSYLLPIILTDQYDGHLLKNIFMGNPVDAPFSFASAATEAKTTVYNEYGDDDSDGIYHDLLLAANIMGDPDLPIWTDTPMSFNDENSPTLGPRLVHSLTGRLWVISPVDSCTIAVLDEYGTQQIATNVSSCSFSGLNGRTNVVIMKHNYVPYMITTNVISSPGISGPYLCASVQNGQIIDVYIDIDNAQTECDVFESSRYEEKIANNWKLAIVDIVTGEVKVNRNINGNHCQIDATGWKSGIYAINGIVNGKSASTKVFIK